MASYLPHERKAGRENPTLAAKLKTKSQLRSKNGAPTFMVEERKEQMTAVFPF